MAERLDAYLARRGHGSRSVVRELIRRGRVTVDGVVCRDAARRVAGEEVRVGGAAVASGANEATLLVHKPVGYAVSHDPREAPLLDELVPPAYRHLPLQAAGRLDRATSGLIVMSTDGQLIHALASPRRALEKRYRVLYRGELAEDAVERVREGLLLRGEEMPTLPARLELEGNDPDEPGLGRATLHIREGRYHQVRRMIAALGGEVAALHRDQIGALELPQDLAPGQAREITDAERELLLG